MKGGKAKAEDKSTKQALRARRKERKAAKDPNKPKRPPSAFFVFMEDFRKKFKEEHPENKAVSVVGKAGGEKWKSLSVADKAPYVEKAEKRKAEYEKKLNAYNNRLAEGNKGEGEGSDKSMSEVNDEVEGDDGSGEDDEE